MIAHSVFQINLKLLANCVFAMPYQISYVWQVLVSENRLAIELSDVDKAV